MAVDQHPRRAQRRFVGGVISTNQTVQNTADATCMTSMRDDTLTAVPSNRDAVNHVWVLHVHPCQHVKSICRATNDVGSLCTHSQHKRCAWVHIPAEDILGDPACVRQAEQAQPDADGAWCDPLAASQSLHRKHLPDLSCMQASMRL